MAASFRIPGQKTLQVPLGLTSGSPALKIEKLAESPASCFTALPPRSMVGQLPLEQHIGVRIPGGQPVDSKGLVGDLFWPNLGHCGNFCGN
jgi:hypothetical protein